MRYLVDPPNPRKPSERTVGSVAPSIPESPVPSFGPNMRERRPLLRPQATTGLVEQPERRPRVIPKPVAEVATDFSSTSGTTTGSSHESAGEVPIVVEHDASANGPAVEVCPPGDFVRCIKTRISIVKQQIEENDPALIESVEELRAVKDDTPGMIHVYMEQEGMEDSIVDILELNEQSNKVLGRADAELVKRFGDPVPHHSQSLPIIEEDQPAEKLPERSSTRSFHTEGSEFRGSGYQTVLEVSHLADAGDILGLLCMLNAEQRNKRMGAAKVLRNLASGEQGHQDAETSKYWQQSLISNGGMNAFVSLVDEYNDDNEFQIVAAETVASLIESYKYNTDYSNALEFGMNILNALQLLVVNEDMQSHSKTNKEAMPHRLALFWFNFLKPFVRKELADGILDVKDKAVEWSPLEVSPKPKQLKIHASENERVQRNALVQNFLEKTVDLMIRIGQQRDPTSLRRQETERSWKGAVNGLVTLSRDVSVTHDVRYAIDEVLARLEIGKPVEKEPPPLALPRWTPSELDGHNRNESATFAQIKAQGKACLPKSFDPAEKDPAAYVDRCSVYDPRRGHNKTTDVVINRKHTSRAYSLGETLKTCIYGRVVCGVKLEMKSDQWEFTQTPVAIKLLSKETILRRQHEESAVEDPETEIAAMQLAGREATKLKSNTVIKTHDVLADDENIYVVMDFCEGRLFDVIASNGPLPEPEARVYFLQILEGLSHVHRAGICHRDLSLENVMIKNGCACIIDFGLSLRIPVEPRRLRKLITPLAPCGKPYYVPPEIQRSEEDFDGCAVDLWTVAVILFIMLVGHPPWDKPGVNLRYNLIALQGKMKHLLKNLDRRHISNNACDLLQSMLYEDVNDRLSMAEVLNHPWLREQGDTTQVHI